jgi:uncharacterized protein YciI
MTVLQLIEHSPGPHWVAGLDLREQPGVEHHLATMRGWLESGRLIMGGPFLDAGGGGAAVVRFDSVEAAQASADADRAVVDGLLLARARPWYVPLASVDLAAQPAAGGRPDLG